MERNASACAERRGAVGASGRQGARTRRLPCTRSAPLDSRPQDGGVGEVWQLGHGTACSTALANARRGRGKRGQRPGRFQHQPSRWTKKRRSSLEHLPMPTAAAKRQPSCAANARSDRVASRCWGGSQNKRDRKLSSSSAAPLPVDPPSRAYRHRGGGQTREIDRGRGKKKLY